MFDIIGKASISEVILVFLLVFLLPLLALLVQRLRRYEALYGDLPKLKRNWGKKKTVDEDGDEEQLMAASDTAVKPRADAADDDSGGDAYPYRAKTFLTNADRACLAAMREVYGKEVEIFPKVALWETIEPSMGGAAYPRRLSDKDFDFLICDSRTMKPLTAVMYNPKKGPAAGRADEIRRICQAAAAPVVFIDMNDKYDAKRLRQALGVPEL